MTGEPTRKIPLPVTEAGAPGDGITRLIWAAEVSLRMENFLATNEARALCRRLLAGELTFEQYFALVASRSGVGRSSSADHTHR